MPTNAHRVQVLLAPDLLEVITKLSDEKGLSMGKTVALLAKEACMNRGLFSPTKGQVIFSLLGEDHPQQFDIKVMKFSVARCRALWINKPLALKETDFRNGDFRKLLNE